MGIFDNKTEADKSREKEAKIILGDEYISKEVQGILKEFCLEDNFELVKDIYEKVKNESINGYIPPKESLNILKERIRFATEDFENLKVELMKKDAEKYSANGYELANPPKLDLLNNQVELLRRDLRKNNELQEEILKILREK